MISNHPYISQGATLESLTALIEERKRRKEIDSIQKAHELWPEPLSTIVDLLMRDEYATAKYFKALSEANQQGMNWLEKTKYVWPEVWKGLTGKDKYDWSDYVDEFLWPEVGSKTEGQLRGALGLGLGIVASPINLIPAGTISKVAKKAGTVGQQVPVVGDVLRAGGKAAEAVAKAPLARSLHAKFSTVPSKVSFKTLAEKIRKYQPKAFDDLLAASGKQAVKSTDEAVSLVAEQLPRRFAEIMETGKAGTRAAQQKFGHLLSEVYEPLFKGIADEEGITLSTLYKALETPDSTLAKGLGESFHALAKQVKSGHDVLLNEWVNMSLPKYAPITSGYLRSIPTPAGKGRELADTLKSFVGSDSQTKAMRKLTSDVADQIDMLTKQRNTLANQAKSTKAIDSEIASLQDVMQRYIMEPQVAGATPRIGEVYASLPDAAKKRMAKDWGFTHSRYPMVDPHSGKVYDNVVDFNKAVGKPMYYEDPALSYAYRQAEQEIAINNVKTTDQLMQAFGANALQVRNKAAAGMVRAEDLVNKQVSGLGARYANTYLPEEIAPYVGNFLDLAFKRPKQNAFLKLHDQAMSLWKSYSYALWPASWLRNTFDNVQKAYIFGMDNPARYKDMLDIQIGKKGTVAGRSTDEWLEVMQKHDIFRGLGEWEIAQDALETLGRTDAHKFLGVSGWGEGSWIPGTADFKGVNIGRNVLSVTESNARGAFFIDRILKGDTAEAAAELTKKVFFDYADLSQFERTVMKRMFPFYTFTRKNIPLQVQAVIHDPKRWIKPIKAAERVLTDKDAPINMKEWQAESMGIPVALEKEKDGSLKSKIFILEYWMSQTNIANLNPKIAFDTATQMVSPMIKQPVEQVVNKNLWLGTPITTQSGMPGLIDRLTNAITSTVRPAQEIKSQAQNPDLLRLLTGIKTYDVPSYYDPATPKWHEWRSFYDTADYLRKKQLFEKYGLR